MPADRFYYPNTLSVGDNFNLEGQESRHLATVMRARVGDIVTVVNGKGMLVEATVAALGKRDATLIVSRVEKEPAPTRELILAQALPRPSRLDTIVEKCTELGMTQLWLFPGERSAKHKLTAAQQDRVQTQMVAAIKQSGRLWLPQLVMMPPLSQWSDRLEGAFYGDVDEKAPALWQQLTSDTPQRTAFIGPESGFSEEEEQQLRLLGAQGISLHHNILRTDTAAIAAMVMMSTR